MYVLIGVACIIIMTFKKLCRKIETKLHVSKKKKTKETLFIGLNICRM